MRKHSSGQRTHGRKQWGDSQPVNGGSFSSLGLQSWEWLASQTHAALWMVKFIWMADAKLAHSWRPRSPRFSHWAGPSSETVTRLEEGVWSLAQVPDPLYGDSLPGRRPLWLYTLFFLGSLSWKGFWLAQPLFLPKGHLSYYSSQYSALKRQDSDRMRTARSGIEQAELYSQLNHLAGLDLFCHFLVSLWPRLDCSDSWGPHALVHADHAVFSEERLLHTVGL